MDQWIECFVHRETNILISVLSTSDDGFCAWKKRLGEGFGVYNEEEIAPYSTITSIHSLLFNLSWKAHSLFITILYDPY